MSQVKFETIYDGKNIEVVGGYDPPLNFYHFTIYNLDQEDDIIWCNLSQYMAFPTNNDRYKELVKEMGIEVPEGFWELCEKKKGNVFYQWDGESWEINTGLLDS